MSSRGPSLLPPAGHEGREGRGAEADLYCEIDGIERVIRAADLSAAGLFVQTTAPPALDRELELFLRSPAGPVTVRGLVVQVVSCAKAEAEARAPGFGMLFIDLGKPQRAWLERTLEWLRAAEPRPRARPRSAPQMPSGAAVQRERLERERSETLRHLEQHLSSIQQRPPWGILGVDADATEEASKVAFLKLSKRYHPHLFARYDSAEISRTATDIFITTKRAYSAMAQSAKAASSPSPKAGRGAAGRDSDANAPAKPRHHGDGGRARLRVRGLRKILGREGER